MDLGSVVKSTTSAIIHGIICIKKVNPLLDSEDNGHMNSFFQQGGRERNHRNEPVRRAVQKVPEGTERETSSVRLPFARPAVPALPRQVTSAAPGRLRGQAPGLPVRGRVDVQQPRKARLPDLHGPHARPALLGTSLCPAARPARRRPPTRAPCMRKWHEEMAMNPHF